MDITYPELGFNLFAGDMFGWSSYEASHGAARRFHEHIAWQRSDGDCSRRLIKVRSWRTSGRQIRAAPDTVQARWIREETLKSPQAFVCGHILLRDFHLDLIFTNASVQFECSISFLGINRF